MFSSAKTQNQYYNGLNHFVLYNNGCWKWCRPHIITSVCSGIFSCQYEINPAHIVTTNKTCYIDVLEQSFLLWFNLIEENMYPQ